MAELYDRARPSYPTPVIEAMINALAVRRGDRILEVGAGTGKATAAAARGLRVVALEPDAGMAAVARDNCAGLDVEIVEHDFEHWPIRERFGGLLGVQSWHWIDHDLRYPRAAAALVPGGRLAAVWMFPDWERCSLQPALSAAYAAAAPELIADYPVHPDSDRDRLAGDWRSEIAESAGFCLAHTAAGSHCRSRCRCARQRV